MDIWGCRFPPSKFEIAMLCVSLVGVFLCFVVGLPLMLLLALGVI